ncbi:MAG: hypothetical protein ACK5MF_06295 [Vibrio sp.]|uniref:hypothetical protein n=1 Tax=Vibrio sp. TaxID=678 RepID=UPI003A870E74
MTQLFRNDEMSELFYGISLTAKQESLINELVKMNQEVIGSKVFGYVLYDNGTFPVMNNIDRDFFAENYMAILDAMATAGVYDSYTFLIRQVLGNGVVIEYKKPNPRHLVINIANIEQTTTKLTTASGLWIATFSGLGIIATQSNSEFTINQLLKVLSILANPSGTYLDVRFGDTKFMLTTADNQWLVTNESKGIVATSEIPM